MKPDWKDAPEWAKWLGIDDQGKWWWFENAPVWTGKTGSSSGRSFETDVAWNIWQSAWKTAKEQSDE